MSKEKFTNLSLPVTITALTALIAGCRPELLSKIDETVDGVTEGCERVISGPNVEKELFIGSNRTRREKIAGNLVCSCHSCTTGHMMCQFRELRDSDEAKKHFNQQDMKRLLEIAVQETDSGRKERIRYHNSKKDKKTGKFPGGVLERDEAGGCHKFDPFKQTREQLSIPPQKCRAFFKSVRGRIKQLSRHYERR